MKPDRNAGREWSSWWRDVGRWAANRSARKGRLKCQRCGRVRREGIPESAEILTCEACGWFGELGDWWKTGRPAEDTAAEGGQPSDTGIRMEEESGQCVFRIPASGNGGGLVVFGWLWTGMSGLILLLSLSGVESGKDLLPVVFVAAFVAIGVGMLYFGYRMKNARHRLLVAADRIELTREWRGRRKTKMMPRRDFVDVRRQVFYTRNYTPVYGIEFRGKSGKLRFGSGLRDDEKIWLVTELRSRLVPGVENGPAGDSPAGDRRRSFTVEVPADSSALGLWLVLLIMGLAFIGISIFAMTDVGPDGGSEAPFLISLIESLFGFLGSFMRLVFGLVGLAMLVGGLVGLVHALKRRGVKRELVGTRDSLLVVDKQQGFVVRKRSFDRLAFREIRITSSGHVNNRPHVKVRMFIGDEVESLASWVDEEKARTFIERVEGFLGRPGFSAAGDVDQGGGGR